MHRGDPPQGTDSPGAVVVGGGPNGLAAAIELARSGVRVLLLEASATIGGGARSAELTLPGYLHDTCSAVHPLGRASPFFSSLPLARHGLEWIQPGLPLVHPLDGGRAVALERSVRATAQGLGGDAEAYRRLLEPLVDGWDRLLGEVLRPPLHLPRHPALMARFGAAAMRSARGLAGRFRGTEARALLAGLAAHSVLPLDRPASAAVAVVLAAAGHAVGWPIPRGGAGNLSAALARQLRVLGGRIEVSAPVGSLAELPRSEVAMLALAPAQVAEIASEALPPRYLRRLRRFRHGPGAFKVDWALAGPIPWRARECRHAGTLHLGGTLEEIAAAEEAPWRGEVAARPFVLLAQPSLFDPTRAPEGGHTAWAYCHVPPGSEADVSEAVEDQVERFAPGFRDRILARATRTARALEAENPSCVGGDITGGVTDLWQLLARPTLSRTPYATPDPTIWICSASTPPGGGVHGMCGYNAARAALSRGWPEV